jgi:hypothetical protein
LTSDIQADKLREVITLIFDKQGDQLPGSFDKFPNDWRQRYHRLAREIDLDRRGLHWLKKASILLSIEGEISLECGKNT